MNLHFCGYIFSGLIFFTHLSTIIWFFACELDEPGDALSHHSHECTHAHSCIDTHTHTHGRAHTYSMSCKQAHKHKHEDICRLVAAQHRTMSSHIMSHVTSRRIT